MSAASDLGKQLKEVYEHPPSGSKTLEIHLFGVRNAEALKTVSVAAVLDAADISPKYATEINKGRRLAPYVELKR